LVEENSSEVLKEENNDDRLNTQESEREKSANEAQINEDVIEVTKKVSDKKEPDFKIYEQILNEIPNEKISCSTILYGLLEQIAADENN